MYCFVQFAISLLLLTGKFIFYIFIINFEVDKYVNCMNLYCRFTFDQNGIFANLQLNTMSVGGGRPGFSYMVQI